MARKRQAGVSFLLIPLLFLPVFANKWWEEEPYTHWSSGQVYKILNDSPWVRLTSAGFRPVQEPWYGASGGQSTHTTYYRSFYRVSVLTARPVREALLRLYSLSSFVVDANANEEAEQLRLKRFVESHPNDLRVKGDEWHIVLGLTGIVRTRKTFLEGPPRMSPENWKEENSLDELYKLEIPGLMKSTSLSTNTGKRVMLSRYEPPAIDGMGARFYFRKTLPDGTPLIRAEDRELLFETRINKTKIKAKFDLREMISGGKLEM